VCVRCVLARVPAPLAHLRLQATAAVVGRRIWGPGISARAARRWLGGPAASGCGSNLARHPPLSVREYVRKGASATRKLGQHWCDCKKNKKRGGHFDVFETGAGRAVENFNNRGKLISPSFFRFASEPTYLLTLSLGGPGRSLLDGARTGGPGDAHP
jgi:hypothetical protein